MEEKKTRAAMRRLRCSPEEFVAALIKFKTTKAMAEHFGVSEHTITLERTRLRHKGVPIPKAPVDTSRKDLSPETVDKLTTMLRDAGMAQAA